MPQEGDRPSLSIVIPVYNEAGALGPLLAEIQETFANHRAEIIVVDDHSDDGSLGVAKAASEAGRDAPVVIRMVRHPARAGKSAALRSGILAARAVWVGTMDGDGQDRPADLLTMAERVDPDGVGEVGLVCGTRLQRTDGASRKWASRIANRLRRTVLKDDCPDTACGLKLIPRDLFLALPFFDALHRYLPALVRRFGFGVAYVPVENRERQFGTSKYSNLGRAAAGAVDLLGVVWLMNRTTIPSPALLLGSDGAQEEDVHVR